MTLLDWLLVFLSAGFIANSIALNWQLRAMAHELAVMRTRWAELARQDAELGDLVAAIAENAQTGMEFVGDLRERVAQLERLARIPAVHAKGPN